jgi:hypothetical protein
MQTVVWKWVCRRLSPSFDGCRDIAFGRVSIMKRKGIYGTYQPRDRRLRAWPFISSISPSTARARGNQFVLTANGSTNRAPNCIMSRKSGKSRS